MNIKELNGTSFAFIGDAVYSVHVREYYVEKGYRQGKVLQKMCNRYVSAAGQTKVYERLNSANFFTEDEQEIFKRGRNSIGHIPKNGCLQTYTVASGLEAIVGYLYLSNKERLELMFQKVFEGGIENE